MIKSFLEKYGLWNEINHVRVYWYWGSYEKGRNFGDALSPYLVEKISGKKVIRSSRYSFGTYYLVIGSILYASSRNAVIWGAGVISRYQEIKKPKSILAVRGPLTRKRLLELGYDCPEIYGDPALLLPEFYKPKADKKYELGIIPNYVDYNFVKNKARNVDKNVLVINLFDPIEQVIEDIFSCKRTISSSLHGIIVSHAYEVPSVWVQFSNKLAGDNSKFYDYFLSVGLSSSYIPPNFKEGILDCKKLCELVDKSFYKPNINVEKLMTVCPFRNFEK